MSVFRIYPNKSNTIASGVYENYNSGQNSVCDLWYGGGGTDTAPEKRNSISRFIVNFDLSELQSKLNQFDINPNRVKSYKLKMKNSIPGDRLLEPEYEFDRLNKNIASSFDLIAFPINKYWEEGRGYDLYKENYVVKQHGNPLTTGYSNWNYATSMTSWDEPGVFSNPTASTTTQFYSGESTYNGMSFIKFDDSSSNGYQFNITGDTGYSFSVSSTTIGNNTEVLFNSNSGVTTLDLQSELNSNSGFTSLGINVTGGNTANTISNTYFTLTSNTMYENYMWSTQHFDLGDEDIEMDVTNIVNDWLSGGSVNYGIGVAFRRDYELLSTDTRYISSFFTEKTNTAFKPYLEVEYDQSFIDDRLQVSNNRMNRLFLYTFSGNSFANYYSAGTVDIKDMSGNIVNGDIVPNQLEKGVYYIDILMNNSSRGQQYKDVWNGITFNPGIDVQDITQVFTVRDNYYLSNVPQVNEYSITTYGIGENSILSIGETHKVFVDLRVNYSNRNQPKTNYTLKYRMVMNNQDEVIPWTSVNQAVINKEATNYFNIETGWLLHNQGYKIEFRVDEFGTSRVLPDSINFRVIRPEGFK